MSDADKLELSSPTARHYNQSEAIGIDRVADERFLKFVWRRHLRPSLRQLKFDGFSLVMDPINFAAYDWGLDALVSALARDLRLGRYSPERGEIVRTAKGNGLSRPLLFLAARDALVYRSITLLVENQLVANSPEWVGFLRTDKGGDSSGEQISGAGSSFDWFQFWLARQGYLANILRDEEVELVVESDIANFYPSIRLEAVREHLHSKTSLTKEVVRLGVQIIDGVMPRQDYSEVSLMGLPQEQVGSSRYIAHSLLQHVDDEFSVEGDRSRYTRFMDDILIGVKTVEEGQRCIARLQHRLEALGLYPNASKTKITTVDEYLHDAMSEENAAIERLGSELDRYTPKPVPRVPVVSSETREEIEEISHEHRSYDKRPRRWGRVMRRIYTLHRKADIHDWWEFWPSDVRRDPGSVASVFEYVRSWPLTRATLLTLTSLSQELCELYADVSILAAEVIATSPNPEDPEFWEDVYRACDEELTRLLALDPRTPDVERTTSSWLLAAWKFSNASQRRALLDRIPPSSDSMSPVRAQALPLLAASGGSLSEWVAAKPGLAWEDALGAEYLRSLREGDNRAVGVALQLIRPQLRLAPQRFITLPRALPILSVLGSLSENGRFRKAMPSNLRDLRKNPTRLRDHRAESLFADWCD